MGGESTALANMVREGPSGEVSLGLRPECTKGAMGKFRGQASAEVIATTKVQRLE